MASFTARLILIKVPTGISVKDRRADTLQIVNAAEQRYETLSGANRKFTIDAVTGEVPCFRILLDDLISFIYLLT